ncbi:MAG TPA: hypothetical protein VGF75_07205 [Candidatus Saccharimonadales bacterium]
MKKRWAKSLIRLILVGLTAYSACFTLTVVLVTSVVAGIFSLVVEDGNLGEVLGKMASLTGKSFSSVIVKSEVAAVFCAVAYFLIIGWLNGIVHEEFSYKFALGFGVYICVGMQCQTLRAVLKRPQPQDIEPQGY